MTVVRERAAKAACMIVGMLLAACLVPAPALAEVRKDDLVAGYTLEERGLGATASPAVIAERAIVMDGDGKVYFERNADDPCHIASITKVMCAIVALENAPLDLEVTVSDRAYEVGESSAGLVRGDKFELGTALKGLMIPSGNDAAIAIAEAVGALIVESGKSASQDSANMAPGTDIVSNEEAYDAFVAKMNETAGRIGLTDTLFSNPHGLDEDGFEDEEMHSTAADVARMCAYAMGFQEFRDIVSTEEETIVVSRDDEPHELELASTDALLSSYEGACGIKTGFTDEAGYCFAGACMRDGEYIFSVALGSTSSEQRFDDTEMMFDWIYDSRVDVPLANSYENTGMVVGGEYSEVPVVAHVSQSDWTDRTVPATLADPSSTVSVSTIFGNVSQEFELDDVKGGVRAGDVIGVVRFYQDNELVAESKVVACEDAEAPSVLDSVSVWWQRVLGAFSGAPSSAETKVLNEMPVLVSKS